MQPADNSYHFKPGVSSIFMPALSLSNGRVTLRSSNPADAPIIENNSPSYELEIREFVDSIRLMRKVLSQPAVAEYIGEDVSPGPQAASDETLEQYVRRCASSLGHPWGTCRMGDPNAAPTLEGACQLVVDAEMHVCGLKGLRVVDESVHGVRCL